MPLSLRYWEKEGGRYKDAGVVCGRKEDGRGGQRVCLLGARRVEEISLAMGARQSLWPSWTLNGMHIFRVSSFSSLLSVFLINLGNSLSLCFQSSLLPI